jgi:hypothetical protein
MRRLSMWLVAATLGVLVTSCTWTMSQDRRSRISDCLSQCNATQAPPQERGMASPNWGLRDSRTSCEQRCHSLK